MYTVHNYLRQFLYTPIACWYFDLVSRSLSFAPHSLDAHNPIQSRVCFSPHRLINCRLGSYCQQNKKFLCIVLSAIDGVMVFISVVSVASALPIFAFHAYIFRMPDEKKEKKNRLEILVVAITVAVTVVVAILWL